MATLYEYYVTGDTIGVASPTLITTPPPPDITTNVRLAQTFTSSVTHTITTVRVFVYRINTPGNFTVGIYAVDGDGHPTGAALCEGTSNGNTLTTSTGGGGRDVSMGAGTLITASTKYAIVLETPNAIPGTNSVVWRCDISGNYANGRGYSYPKVIDSETTEDDWYTLGYEEIDFKFSEFGNPTAPQKPINPTPANDATGVDFTDYTISWEDGGDADTYDVYIGETGNLTLVSSAQAGLSYISNLDEIEEIFAVSPIDQKIYWRIDATNEVGTTAGDEWNFDARPAKVTNPTPEAAAEDIKLFPEYSWDASTVATSYDLYVGIDEIGGAFSIEVPGLSGISYDSAVVDFQNSYIWGYNSLYVWRVDAVNGFGTTTGDEWSFNTISLEPSQPYTILPGGNGNGPFDSPSGTQGVDWQWNAAITMRRLVAATANTFWYEVI